MYFTQDLQAGTLVRASTSVSWLSLSSFSGIQQSFCQKTLEEKEILNY